MVRACKGGTRNSHPEYSDPEERNEVLDMRVVTVLMLIGVATAMAMAEDAPPSALQKVKYNHPGLVVDLGVGLWAQPLPVDYDGDGDNDLLMATADVPSNGIYFFENPGGDSKFPVFKPGIWLGKAVHNTTISYAANGWQILTPGKYYPDFRNSFLDNPHDHSFKQDFYAGRTNQWKYCDYDGDGITDLIAGVSDWREYGWDNAFNEKGEWTQGPLHGYVYFIKNTGTNEQPAHAPSVQLQAEGKPMDVYGCPSPNFADWDGDGDLDLICGEFLDRLTYFENTGTRTAPNYRAGKFLTCRGEVLRMDLEMMQAVAFDWDRDGDTDLVVGQEDGRVALIEYTGEVADGMPQFLPPRFFRQEAEYLKTGALSTPFSVDWDGDGDEDLLTGDTAGYVNFVENLDGGNPPKWAAPVYLQAGGEVIRIQAGPNGSIQGPAEAKWGYTVFNVADWDHDGLLDIVLNSIRGEVLWYRNSGARTSPQLDKAQPVEVEWDGPAPKPAWCWWNPKGKQLVTQWRTTPAVVDWNRDGLNDLVMLDPEGYLTFFERRKTGDTLALLPGKRIFEDESGAPLRLNERAAGKSGRRKFTVVDWDRDGKRDILIDGKNIDFLQNIGENEYPGRFQSKGRVDSRILAGHDTCPTTVDWDRNGVPDLLIGAEDGFFYHLQQ